MFNLAAGVDYVNISYVLSPLPLSPRTVALELALVDHIAVFSAAQVGVRDGGDRIADRADGTITERRIETSGVALPMRGNPRPPAGLGRAARQKSGRSPNRCRSKSVDYRRHPTRLRRSRD